MSTQSKVYQGDLFIFSYPANADIVEFHKNTIRIVLREENQPALRYNLRPWAQYHTAKEAAEHIYQSMPELENDSINVPPYAFVGAQAGWRCRKRFIEGGRAPLVIEMAFFQISNDVYQLEFAAAPDIFEQGIPIFDLFVSSFTIVVR